MLYTKGVIDVSPSDVGYDASRIDALHRHFERLIDEDQIQCASYCVSRKGKIFMNGAVGPIQYNDSEKPMRPDTVNGIASITKIFTTVAVMKLIEDGLLRLDTPIHDIIPAFSADPFHKITIYHLLTHTSGMIPDAGYADTGNRNYWSGIRSYIETYNPATDGEFNWVQAALQAGVRKEPDVEWMYCSFGFCILGEVISNVSKKSAHQYIIDEIVKPLGMQDTGFGGEITPEIAKRYLIGDEQREKRINDMINGNMKEESAQDRYWSNIPSTGGGLYSTPYDLIKFGNMCMNMGRLDGVRIAGRKIFERFTTRALYNKPNYAWGANISDRAYGIGFDMKRECEYVYSEGSFYHEGAGACALIIDPKEEMVAAYFVPFTKDGWFTEAVYNTQVVIWYGLE